MEARGDEEKVGTHLQGVFTEYWYQLAKDFTLPPRPAGNSRTVATGLAVTAKYWRDELSARTGRMLVIP